MVKIFEDINNFIESFDQLSEGNQYILVAFCFLFLIAIRLFLARRTYKDKMIYYTDPMTLAEEALQSFKKKSPKQELTLDQLKQVVEYNFKLLSVLYSELENSTNKREVKEQISQKLRHIAMYLCIAKIQYKDETAQSKNSKMNIFANIIGPQQQLLSKIQDSAKKTEKQKLESALDLSIRKYIDGIIQDMGQYLYGL